MGPVFTITHDIVLYNVQIGVSQAVEARNKLIDVLLEFTEISLQR